MSPQEEMLTKAVLWLVLLLVAGCAADQKPETVLDPPLGPKEVSPLDYLGPIQPG